MDGHRQTMTTSLGRWRPVIRLPGAPASGSGLSDASSPSSCRSGALLTPLLRCPFATGHPTTIASPIYGDSSVARRPQDPSSFPHGHGPVHLCMKHKVVQRLYADDSSMQFEAIREFREAMTLDG